MSTKFIIAFSYNIGVNDVLNAHAYRVRERSNIVARNFAHAKLHTNPQTQVREDLLSWWLKGRQLYSWLLITTRKTARTVMRWERQYATERLCVWWALFRETPIIFYNMTAGPVWTSQRRSAEATSVSATFTQTFKSYAFFVAYVVCRIKKAARRTNMASGTINSGSLFSNLKSTATSGPFSLGGSTSTGLGLFGRAPLSSMNQSNTTSNNTNGEVLLLWIACDV